MFCRQCRFQRDDRSKSIEVDAWGHGVRVRLFDNMTGEARSVFLDQDATRLLAERLTQFVGMADTIKSASKRAETLALLARAMDTLRAEE
jgi:hypothetical protein